MKTVSRSILYLSCLIFNLFCASAQKTGFTYYDLDRLYDTLPSLFYNDTDYTPQGRLEWNTARYQRKICHTAAVIDSMALPVVALWGVENEAVARDIAVACRGDYSYLHRTLNTFDGMDFALLYYGDLFDPHHIEEGRGYLYVEGTLHRDTLGLVLCSDPRMAAWVVRDLRDDRPHAKLMVMGRTESLKNETLGLRNATARAARAGRGTIRRSGRWQMRDQIWADTSLNSYQGDVFARRFLIDPKTGTPLSSYSRGRYQGGYSASLPVFTYIR